MMETMLRLSGAVVRHIASFMAGGMLLAAVTPLPVEAASYTERTYALLQALPPGVSLQEPTEDGIFSLLNKLRASKGLSILKPAAGLRDAARAHVLRMQRDAFFAHADPDGRGAVDRVAALDRSTVYGAIAENLAKIGPPSGGMASKMHQGWVNSPGHYKNMISPQYSHVGVGCIADRQAELCAQVFGKKAGILRQPLPVRLTSSSRTNVAAAIEGLDYGGWILMDQGGAERAVGHGNFLKWPQGLAGEVRLRIIGSRREGNRIYQYHFFGPSAVIQ